MTESKRIFQEGKEIQDMQSGYRKRVTNFVKKGGEVDQAKISFLVTSLNWIFLAEKYFYGWSPNESTEPLVCL